MSDNPIYFASREALMQAAAERMAAALNDALNVHGDAAIALSGGSTPEAAYRLLAEQKLDWARITLALVDERFVPPEHEASNEGLIRRAFAGPLTRGAKLVPLYSAAASLEAAADRADALYAPLRIDYALMGMGLDGHIASWFRDSDAVWEAINPDNPRSVMAVRAPSAAGSTERLTMTFSALKRASRAELLITGAEKMDVLNRAYMSWLPAQELFRLNAFYALYAP